MKPQSRTRTILRSGLTSTQRLVCVAIMDYADADDEAYPSASTVAHDTGLTDRTVRKAVKAMLGNGLTIIGYRSGCRVFRLDVASLPERCSAPSGTRFRPLRNEVPTPEPKDHSDRNEVPLTPEGGSDEASREASREASSGPKPHEEVFEVWRKWHPRATKLLAADATLIKARIRDSDVETCKLVAEWAHLAPAADHFRGNNDRKKKFLGIGTLYKAKLWSDRADNAHAWVEAGRPEGDAPQPADHKRDAEIWFSALLGLASKGKKPNRVESMLAMLGHDGAPSPKSLAAWAALDSIGRCTDLGHATTFEVHALRKTFISTYTAARCNGSATSPVEAT